MKCKIFHPPESLIIHLLPSTIIFFPLLCRFCAATCKRSEVHKSRGSRGTPSPLEYFVNMTSRMARMHLARLILRQFDLQLIVAKFGRVFDSSL